MNGGKCDRCTNVYSKRYIRSRGRTGSVKMLCRHCIDLEEKSSGRESFGLQPQEGNPLNQPAPISMHGGLDACTWCGQPATPKYLWNNQKVTFCGWGHAGLWMDREMDKIDDDLIEGEAYVRRSLGVE